MGTPANKFDHYVLKNNVSFPHDTRGYQFHLDFPALPAKGDKILRGRVLASLYSACIAKNVSIVSAMCHVIQTGKKGQTIECLNSPVVSDFPPADDYTAANGTLRLGDGTGTGTMGQVPTITAPAQFDVGDADDAALFRLEGEDYVHTSRDFNGIPDGYIERMKAIQLDPDFEFYTAGGVDYTIDTVPDTVHNFWANWKPFMDYIVKNGVIVKKRDIGDEVVGPDTNLWNLYDIERVVFERISEKKIGDSFGHAPGRRAG